MILEVQICTFGAAGLARVATMQLPEVPGVRYMVSLQNPDGDSVDIPQPLRRSDLTVFQHPTRGLSINRNMAIDHSDADIILIADDDLNYTARGLETVLDTFHLNPDLDFATFMHTGADNKRYPEGQELKLRLPKGYYLTSFELAIRRSSLPPDLRFSPNMGIGAPLFGAGEENLLLMRMIKKGLKGRFVPEVVVEHPGLSTGMREATPAFLRAQGAWIRLYYGALRGAPRIILDAARRNAPYFKALFYLSVGFIRSFAYFTSDGEEKRN